MTPPEAPADRVLLTLADVLDEGGSASLREIARRMHVEHTTVRHHLQRWAAQGVVVLPEWSMGERRWLPAGLTPDGRVLVNSLRAAAGAT